MNGTWNHGNLETIKKLKDQTQKRNAWSKSTVETLEEGVICSKLTIKTAERQSRYARV